MEEEKQIIIDNNKVPLSSALLMIYKMVKDMKDSMDEWFDEYRKSGALEFDRRIGLNEKDISELNEYKPMLSDMKFERENNKQGWFGVKFGIIQLLIFGALIAVATTFGVAEYLK